MTEESKVILDKTHLTEIDPSETVIYKYIPSYEELEQENEYLKAILNNIHNYIEKMSYCEVVDNPKKELSRILERQN